MIPTINPQSSKPTSKQATFPLRVLDNGSAAIREIFRRHISRGVTTVSTTLGLTAGLTFVVPSIYLPDEGFVSTDILAQSQGLNLDTYLQRLYRENPSFYYDLYNLTYIAHLRMTCVGGKVQKRSLLLYIPVSADHKSMLCHDVTPVYDPSVRQALTDRVVRQVLMRLEALNG